MFAKSIIVLICILSAFCFGNDLTEHFQAWTVIDGFAVLLWAGLAYLSLMDEL